MSNDPIYNIVKSSLSSDSCIEITKSSVGIDLDKTERGYRISNNTARLTYNLIFGEKVNNTINFTQHVLKKDLEAYSAALFEQTQKLMIENQELKEKLRHLEELLVSSTNIPTLTNQSEQTSKTTNLWKWTFE